VTLVTTGRLDAVLHEPPPERTAHTIGRPRVVGERLPSLEQVLQDEKTVWQELTVDWYGQGARSMEICSGTALWYRSGSDPLPIRWVLTRDPAGKRPPKVLFSTDPTQTAEQIVNDFMKRWSLEVTGCQRATPIWVLRPNANGLIELSSVPPRSSSVSTAWLPSLDKPSIQMGTFLSDRLLGIVNRHPPFVMSWHKFEGICGAIFLFQHHPLILMWF